MGDSNRVRLGYIEEVTLGTTPAVAQSGTAQSTFRTGRMTGEGLNFAITNIVSNEIRADRNKTDLIQTAAQNAGEINFELSFAETRTFFDQMLGGAMFANWTNTAEKFNVTADTSITDAGTVANTYAVDAGGTAFVTGHLCRAAGFTNSANNQLFRVTSSTGTTVVGTALGLTAETAPPAGARLKVVGAEGASGDVTATASGLASTLLNFVNLGLIPGQWIKVGGSLVGQQFATAANNDWIRVTAVAATALTCDNLPSGWGVDAGAAKTIRFWFGDVIRNGTTRRSFTFEKGFLDMAAPAYAMYRGCVAGGLNLQLEAQAVINGSIPFLGMTHAASTTPFDAPGPAAATTKRVLNATSNVGRIAENGTLVTGPNFVRAISVALNNNLREQNAIGTLGLVGIGVGSCDVSGQMTTYFGSTALYDKYVAGTETSVNCRSAINSQAMVFTFPRVKFESGNIVASGPNQDVLATLGFRALLDTLTNCQFQMDRVEEFA